MENIKFLLLMFLTFILISGCRNENTENQDETVDSVTVIESEPVAEPEEIALPYIVTFDDNTGKLEIEKIPESTTYSNTAEQIAVALNTKYPEITLQVSVTHLDTLVLSAHDYTQLTHCMGT